MKKYKKTKAEILKKTTRRVRGSLVFGSRKPFDSLLSFEAIRQIMLKRKAALAAARLKANKLESRFKIKDLGFRKKEEKGRKSIRVRRGEDGHSAAFYGLYRIFKYKLPRGLAHPGTKIGAAIILFTILTLGSYSVESTVSYYSDEEKSEGNILASTILDFILVGTTWVSETDAADLDPGDSVTRDVKVVDTQSIDFTYIVEPVQTSGDAEFCSSLQAEVFLEGVSVYTGNLFDFTSASTTYGVTGDDWTFRVFRPVDALLFDGRTCSFNFDYKGWQEEFAGLVTGYNDIEQTDNQLEVKACLPYEIRSMGFWKNHEELWIFPQTLGANEIVNATDAQTVFNANNNAEDRLRKQLLALKFNIAHFGSGDALVPGETITLDELAALADTLLTNGGSDSDYETMKNRVEVANTAHAVSTCPTDIPPCVPIKDEDDDEQDDSDDDDDEDDNDGDDGDDGDEEGSNNDSNEEEGDGEDSNNNEDENNDDENNDSDDDSGEESGSENDDENEDSDGEEVSDDNDDDSDDDSDVDGEDSEGGDNPDGEGSNDDGEDSDDNSDDNGSDDQEDSNGEDDENDDDEDEEDEDNVNHCDDEDDEDNEDDDDGEDDDSDDEGDEDDNNDEDDSDDDGDEEDADDNDEGDSDEDADSDDGENGDDNQDGSDDGSTGSPQDTGEDVDGDSDGEEGNREDEEGESDGGDGQGEN